LKSESRFTWSTWLAAAVTLAALNFLVHGISLRGGLFMDDWAHIRQLREAGWNLRDLVAACRLELVGGVAEMWFMPDCTLRFFRPVAFAVMKLTYMLSGWSPLVMHAASIGWHLVVCLLLLKLLERLGARRIDAWIVTALFAVHPGHVVTVQWIAVQTELIVTVCLLLATLAFARFRGWPAAGEASAAPTDAAAVPPRGDGPWLYGGLACVFYLLALGCRENAIMFPFVMAVMEPVVGRRGRKRAFALYVLLCVVALGYLAVRWHYLGGVQVPPRPYIYPPSDPGFVRFIFDKLCYYLLGEFLIVPNVPIGGLPYFRTMPIVFYGLSAALLGLLAWNVVGWLRRAPGALGSAWLVFFLLPLLPAFSSPHHLYLPGIGAAIITWFVLRTLTQPRPAGQPQTRPFNRREVVYATMAVGLTAFTAASAFVPVLAIDTGQRVEDTITDEVAAAPSGLKDGDTLYVVNLPIIAHYLKLMVEERTGLRDLRVVPLTWAPRVLGLFGTRGRAEYEWQDAKTLDIRIAHERWFADVFGTLADEALRRDIPVSREKPVEFRDRNGELDFVVKLLEGDDTGITALRFEFTKPPIRPGSHIFWGSNIRWAYELPAPQFNNANR
jgi:hypothetical protein